ncbi:MAG: hypothetical protein PHO91_04350 [Patescibacteria group bacterium]|nr:hypothetical protein [Patescibacteria group bacterium]
MPGALDPELEIKGLAAFVIFFAPFVPLGTDGVAVFDVGQADAADIASEFADLGNFPVPNVVVGHELLFLLGWNLSRQMACFA